MDCFCAQLRALENKFSSTERSRQSSVRQETFVSQSKHESVDCLTNVPPCSWKTGLRMKSCLGSNLQQSTGFGKISGFSPSHTLKPSHLSLKFALTLHLAMARAGRHALPDEKTRVEAAWNFYRALVAVHDQTWMVSKPMKPTSYFQMVKQAHKIIKGPLAAVKGETGWSSGD